MEPLFKLEGVSFGYDGIPALQSLSLTIDQGQRVALVGANGSGKSTLLRVLNGLSYPDSGILRFRGDRVTEANLSEPSFNRKFRRAVGFVFQNPDVQLFNPTVFDEIAFGPLQLGLANQEVLAMVNRAIESMGLGALRSRPPFRLSGGEKKKVALASVLVMDPNVLLFDEPTSALDPRSQSRLIELVNDWKTPEKTVITATHQLDLVEELADIVYVMDSGLILASGTPTEILANTDLLIGANLVHDHRHRHGATTHRHPHRHAHSHEDLPK